MTIRIICVVLILTLLNCSNERLLQLPEVKTSNITKVVDISPAYIFYEPGQPDSSFLNRKNLISTTNWIVNVDKRLTLKQVLPHLQVLQNKKRNAKMHKNENARTYYSCNNTTISNLGFIDFTEVTYKNENPDFIEFSKSYPNRYALIKVYPDNLVSILNVFDDVKTEEFQNKQVSNFSDFGGLVKSLGSKHLIFFFHEQLLFQEYMTLKSYLEQLDREIFEISEIEYLFH